MTLRGDLRQQERALDHRDAGAAEHDAVYVAAPPLDDPRTAVLLDQRRPVAVVASEGGTARQELAAASDTLGRLGVPVLGVVVTSATPAPRAAR